MSVIILLIVISFLGGVIFMLYWFLKSMKTKKGKASFLGQLLCSHDYQIDDPNEVFPIPVDGTWVSYSRWHTCSKCGKKELIGSGMIG
jgi:hypothetical protein